MIDFAPRFLQFGRAFRPTQLVRIVEPLEGTPRIVVVCDPRLGWSKERPSVVQGSHHVRYEGFASQLRLTTDIPLSYLSGQPFTLTGRQHLVLTWGAPVEEPLRPLCERFWNETARYWQDWVKQCDIPPLFQQEVIRSALTLKLHCFEDTGAIIAAMTTSIPESPGSGRTWDYRYCWLRDSYYVLSAFGLLGQFEEREQFVQYLLNVAGGAPGLNLAPLYRVDGSSNLEESILENWAGYNGEQPVRIGNGAALHSQHDIYGEMVLALAPIFLDERMSAERSGGRVAPDGGTGAEGDFAGRCSGRGHLGVPHGMEAADVFQPDVLGRGGSHGGDRAASMNRRVPANSATAADRIHAEVIAQSWNARRGSFVGHYGGEDLDASLLQMVRLRFLPTGDPRLGKHDRRHSQRSGARCLAAALQPERRLRQAVGRFRHLHVLADRGAGRRRAPRRSARRVRPDSRGALAAGTAFGGLSTTAPPRMWGNFPQTYSHVGLIHAAFAASPTWTEVL